MSVMAGRWKPLPTAASFLVTCGLLTGGAIYLVNYWDRDAYLTSRNFRLLAVLAKQTEAAIDSHSNTEASKRGTARSQLKRVLRVGEGRPTITLRDLHRTEKDTATPVGQILTQVFAPKTNQGAFDTLALATTDGHVVFAVGLREWELNSMSLAALLPERPALPAPDKLPPSSIPPANAFTRIAVLDSIVAGMRYKMFVQPCCQLVTQESVP